VRSSNGDRSFTVEDLVTSRTTSPFWNCLLCPCLRLVSFTATRAHVGAHTHTLRLDIDTHHVSRGSCEHVVDDRVLDHESNLNANGTARDAQEEFDSSSRECSSDCDVRRTPHRAFGVL
jgi:hypothetical protein